MNNLKNVSVAMECGTDLNGKAYKGLSKAAAVKEICQSARLIGTRLRDTNNQFNIRLIDKDMRLPYNAEEGEARIKQLSRKVLQHLCEGGQARIILGEEKVEKEELL